MMGIVSEMRNERTGGVGPRPIDFAAELNAEQYAAVTASDGAALVIAGAGSGKTRALTYRVAWLLSQGVRPWEILLLTFTNKAAREMVDRVAGLVPGAAEGVWAGTFHSIGNRILRRHAERIGFQRGFSILDREDSEAMIADVVADGGFADSGRRFPKASVLADIFSLSINTGQLTRELLAGHYTYFLPLSEQIEQAHLAYETRKKEANSMDFDDLLVKVHELFALHPQVAAEYQRKFRHILVDEYQDTNRLQVFLVDLLARGHDNLMVVGDDAQSIYSWRGADPESILSFPRHHPEAKIFKIETNYRSVPQVLDVANAAIEANERQFPKALHAARGAHPTRPVLAVLPTSQDQAAFIAERILEFERDGGNLEEIAILYRAHFHSMEIQMELTRRGIPFTITSGLRFFEQAHVKDVAAFLKFAVNPRDETAFKRIVQLFPGVGPKSAAGLWSKVSALLNGGRDFSALHGVKAPAKATRDWSQLAHTLADLVPPGGTPLSPAQMIEAALFAVYDDFMKEKFTNYEARRDDLGTLTEYARQFETTEDFLAQMSLLAGVETNDALASDSASGKVTLSTVHQAKGLEWRTVFLVWLAEGMFPHERSAESDEGLEEERRLFYVGITRCKENLFLTYPEMRLHANYGDTFQEPSSFLSEIPESLLETWEPDLSSADAPF